MYTKPIGNSLSHSFLYSFSLFSSRVSLFHRRPGARSENEQRYKYFRSIEAKRET